MNTRITLIFIVNLFCFQMLGQWTPTNGPYGGLTNCFAHHGEFIFAGTQFGGVFYSDNGGASWEKRNNGFANLGPTGLGVGTLWFDGEVAYAGIGVNGFYRSTNMGLEWEPITSVWLSYSLTAIEVVGEHLFAGTAGGGIQVSHDYGQTWQLAMEGILPFQYYSVQKFLVINQTVYVLVNGKMYSSFDYGDNWDLINNGLPESTYSVHQSDDYLIASTAEGMYRSSDGGEIWTGSNTGLDIQSFFLLNCTTSGSDIFVADSYYAVMYYSADYGATWTQLDYPFDNSFGAIYALGNGSVLFQTSTQASDFVTHAPAGLYRSDDLGGSWVNITNEIDGTFCMALEQLNGVLFCSTNATGVYKSTNEGLTWEQSGLLNWHVRTLYSTDVALFAGGSNGVYRTMDNGVTWEPCLQGLTNTSVHDLCHIDDNLFVGTADGVFISTNNGDSWSLQNNGMPPGVALSLCADAAVLYAGTTNGIYRSTNYGNSWQSVSAGLPAQAFYSSIIKYNDYLITASGLGLYRSQDDGQNWQLLFEGQLVSDAFQLVATNDKIFACRLSPVVGYDGVFVSFDDGMTWEGQSEGITNNQVYDLVISGDDIYAATLGSGCFKRPLAEFSPLHLNTSEENAITLYPNPTHDMLFVQLASDQIGQECKLYNQSGQLIRSLGVLSSPFISMPCTDLAAGIYVFNVGNINKTFVVD
jgi:photosystem II stability/assembly factor-like uncharacterized protein